MMRAALFCAVGVLISSAAHAQAPNPQGKGRLLEAFDGDIVMVRDAGTVHIVRRTEAPARVALSTDRRTILIATPEAEGPSGASPNGGARRVRYRLYGFDVAPPWPLGDEWEGTLTIDEYLTSHGMQAGVLLHTDRGSIFLGATRQVPLTTPPQTILQAVRSSSNTTTVSLEEVVPRWRTGGDASLGAHEAGAVTSMSTGPRLALSANGPQVPLRVGGDVPTPRRLVDAAPEYPQNARNAGIQGVVILELTVATDGSVSAVRVLRSIPLLDEAAVATARQWRYEPVVLNGTPVSVLLTAIVNFTLGR